MKHSKFTLEIIKGPLIITSKGNDLDDLLSNSEVQRHTDCGYTDIAVTEEHGEMIEEWFHDRGNPDEAS